MKLTNLSKQYLSFLTKNKYINHIKHETNTNRILTKIYYDILKAYEFLQNVKKNGIYNYKINIIIFALLLIKVEYICV